MYLSYNNYQKSAQNRPIALCIYLSIKDNMPKIYQQNAINIGRERLLALTAIRNDDRFFVKNTN